MFERARPERVAPAVRLEPGAVRVPRERVAAVVGVELAAPAVPRERVAPVDRPALAALRARAERVTPADALPAAAVAAVAVVFLDERRVAPDGVSALRSLSKSLSIRSEPVKPGETPLV